MAWVSDTVFSFLILSSGVLAASTFGFAVAWLRARERAIRAEQRLAPDTEAGDARLAHLEHALDAMAGEVEQVVEGQRFVSKLLAERPAQVRDASARPASVATSS